MTAGIVDLVFTSDKRMVVLDDAGTLWIQSDIGLEHASKPIGARPRYGWKKISPMPPVRVTRLIGGSHQNLVVLGAGGRAYEQMPDTDNVNNPFLHQRHAAPRKELYHLLSLAVANFEVNKREEASNHARQLVELLHSKGIIL